MLTIGELKKMIEVAEQLGHGDATVCISDGRDGQASYPYASAKFVDIGTQADPAIILAIT